MGQQDIYDYLKKNTGKWFCSQELASALDISIGSVTMSLKKLRKTDMVEHRKVGFRNGYEYSVGK